MTSPTDPLLEGAREVARVLRDKGFEAYFAGGCVRDTLRGEAPKDYDIATNAIPDEVAKIFRRTVLVGEQFGVVRVRMKGCEYEVATYRKDTTYSDGRRPDAVVYSKSKEEDVERRDFTINALLMDPDTREVIDVVGGRTDLEKKVIRAVGDPAQRIAEDRLRMLRAVRFAARFGFEIEAKTLDAIGREAAAITQVSVERIVTELEGIFSSKDPVRGFELLVSTGLFPHVLPDVHPSVTERLGRLAPLDKERRVLVAWAAVLSDITALEERLRSLKLSRQAMRAIMRLVAARPILLAPETVRLAERVGIAIDPDVELFLAYLLAMGGSVLPWRALLADLSANPLPALPLVTGEDLKAMGIPTGPRYKDILKAVEVDIFERRITTKEAALARVAELGKS